MSNDTLLSWLNSDTVTVSVWSEPASNSPDRVIFLKPEISLFVSTITALLAATVPSVIEWIWLSSAAVASTSVPAIDNSSVSNFPLTSTLPSMSNEVASISPLDLNVTPSLPPTSNTIWSLVSNLIRLSSSRPIAKPVFFILVIALWVGKIDTSTLPDEPPPFIPPPAVMPVISPGAFELRAANCDWISLVTLLRKPYSALDTFPLAPTKAASSLLEVVIVSCLILLSWLSWVCTSNVVLLKVLSWVAVAQTGALLIVNASVSNVPSTSTLFVTVTLSTKVSLNLAVVEPKSTVLSVCGPKTPSDTNTCSVLAA